MRYLLDTNICIYLIKHQPTQVFARFAAHQVGDIGISTITQADLQNGAAKSQRPEHNLTVLTEFLAPLAIMSFDTRAAVVYGTIRSTLERQGQPIGPLDFLIAAHARALGAVLVTNNLAEFQRVPGLVTENWCD